MWVSEDKQIHKEATLIKIGIGNIAKSEIFITYIHDLLRYKIYHT